MFCFVCRSLNEDQNGVHLLKYYIYLYEGKATRLAELALIFFPIYNVAVSDTSHSKL